MNKLKHILMALAALLCLQQSAHAQNYPNANWLKNNTGNGGSDAGNAVAYDASGNMYVAGYFQGEFNPDNTNATTTWNLTSKGNNDMYLAKYNSNGSIIWAFGMGGTGNEQFTSISVDGSGNIYVAGYVSSTAAWDADPSSNTNNVNATAGVNDIFVAKYDGTLTPSSTSFYKWAFVIGGTNNDLINGIAVDGSGNVYVAGYTQSGTNWDANPSSNVNNVATSANADMFIAKYDGTLTPSNTSFYKWAFTMGGSIVDQLNSIALDGSGNLYVAGYTSSSTSWDADPSSNTNNLAASAGNSDIFIAKYDGTLTPSNTSFYKWAFVTGGNSTDLLLGVSVDGSGNVYVAGYTSSTTNWDADPSSNTNNVASSAGNDIFIAKYDGTLTPSNTSFYKWAFVMGGNSTDQLQGVSVDGSGNVYVAGYTMSTFTWDADPSSNTNNMLASSGSSDMFIAKYDGTLTPSNTSFYKWAFTMGNTSADQLNAITVDGSGNIYVAGITGSGSWDADPSSNTNNINASNGNQDIVAMIYNGTVAPSSTSFYKAAVWAGNGPTTPAATTTTTDAAGNVYTAGYFNATITLGTTSLRSNGVQDIYLAKYNSAGSLLWAFSMGGTGSDQLTGITVDGSGNVYIAGYTNSTSWDADPSSNTNAVASSAGGNDMFIAKYDGTLTPSNTSFYKWAFLMGGGNADAPQGISLDNSGNVYIAGYTTSNVSWDADPSSNTNNVLASNINGDMFIAKYDGSLTPSNTSFYKWATVIGGSGTDQLQGINVDGSGNVYVAGYTGSTTSWDADPSSNTNAIASSAGGNDMFIAKYDGSLSPSNTSFYKWAFTMGGSIADQLNSIALDGSGNVYVGGYTASTFNWDANPSSNTNNVASTGSYDMFIAKYDGTLTPSNTSFYKWAFAMGSSGANDVVTGIATDGSGNVYIGGYTASTGSWDADPSSNTNNVASVGNIDIFMAKYDGSLTPTNTSFYKWAAIIGSTGIDQLNCISANGKTIVAGGQFTASNQDFQPGSNTKTLSSAQNGLAQSQFLGKYIDGITWTGGTSTAWATGSNWVGSAAPTTTDYAYIPASGVTNEPAVSSNTTIGGLIVDAGRTVTINSSVALSVTGDVTNNGTISSTGKLALTGSSAQYLGGTGSYSNLELNNSTGATNAGTINLTDTYTPTSGVLTTGGNLVLKSTSGGTGRIATGATSGGYISGNVTIERYLPGKRAYRFFSHPFNAAIALSQLTDNIDITGSGGSTNGFTTTNTNNASSYWYDVTAGDNTTGGNNPGWTAFTNTNGAGANAWSQYGAARILVRGTKGQGLTSAGYTPGAATIDMSGVPNQGDVTISLTKGSGTSFVLVGNPFPSQVNMDAVSTSNVGSAFYIWDATQGTKGGYTSYTFGSSSFNLPSCGAFVTTLSANGSIVFEEADKTSGTSGTMFKTTAPANTVQLRLEDSTTFWDRLLLRFDDNAMATVDYPDAAKLYNPDMSFYTWSKDDSMLSIDVRPYVDGEIIPLGLYSTLKKNFRIIAADFDMPLGTKLFLHDKFLNTTEEITGAGYEYWFSVDANPASWGDNRFELNTQGKPVNDIATVSNTKLKVKLVPNPATDNVTVYTEGNNGKQVLVTITNMMGTKVAEHYTTGNTTISLSNMAAGIYIVNISCGSETITQKLIKQ